MWQNDGCSETAIKAFLYNFEKLTSGANLMIPESALSAVESLPSYDALTEEKPELLKDTGSARAHGRLRALRAARVSKHGGRVEGHKGDRAVLALAPAVRLQLLAFLVAQPRALGRLGLDGGGLVDALLVRERDRGHARL